MQQTRPGLQQAPVKLSYTLSESIQQLSKPPEFTPFIHRPDWHATQLFLMLVFVATYMASWSTDYVSLVVRHHRLETFDKRRIFMLYRDERVRMMAAESVPQAPPAQAREIVELREELNALRGQIGEIKGKLGALESPALQRRPLPALAAVFRGWVPKVEWR